MQIQESARHGVTVLRLFGEIDAASAPVLQTRLQQLTSEDRRCVVLDLSGVPFMSSAGLRVLHMGLRDCRASGGEIRLAGLEPPVQSVLQQTGLANLFATYPDTDAALVEFDVSVVALKGALDASSAPDVEVQLRAHIVGGSPRLVLDMSQVNYVASAGLRIFQVLMLAARSQQGDIRLAAVQPAVKKVMDTLGFSSLFKSYDTVTEARQSYL